MKPKKIILGVVVFLIVVAFTFAIYIGVFTGVKVEEKVAGGYKVIGKEIIGPYSKVGESMKGVDEKLRSMGIACDKGFGIYYDDPKITDAEKCRSFVGNIIEEKDLGKISELASAGFKVDSIRRASAVVAEFPMKSSMSYAIGAMKAYPVLGKYVKEKGYKSVLVFEIYDMPGKKIVYVMQYDKY